MADVSGVVKDANGREIEVRSLGVGELFDVLELAEGASQNQAWLALAMTVAAARRIGEHAQKFPTTKAQVKALGVLLDGPGLAAVRGVLFPVADVDAVAAAPDAEVSAAKN